jgi:hypothetical protein
VTALAVPVLAALPSVLGPVIPGSEQDEVVDPVIPLVVVLVVHLHAGRYRPDLTQVHPSVQQPSSAVPVVGIPLVRVPAHAVVFDELSHVTTVSFFVTDWTCFHS